MSHTCDGRDLSCLGCAALARRNDTVRAAMTLDDRLDDIKRVQIWARIDESLSAPARRRSWWPAFAAVAIAGAAIVVAVARRPATEEPQVLSAPADTTLSAALGPHTRAALEIGRAHV